METISGKKKKLAQNDAFMAWWPLVYHPLLKNEINCRFDGDGDGDDGSKLIIQCLW